MGFCGMTLLVVPAAVLIGLTFLYPVFYGLALSFHVKEGGAFADYVWFFSDPFMYQTIRTTRHSRSR